MCARPRAKICGEAKTRNGSLIVDNERCENRPHHVFVSLAVVLAHLVHYEHWAGGREDGARLAMHRRIERQEVDIVAESWLAGERFDRVDDVDLLVLFAKRRKYFLDHSRGRFCTGSQADDDECGVRTLDGDGPTVVVLLHVERPVRGVLEGNPRSVESRNHAVALVSRLAFYSDQSTVQTVPVPFLASHN